VRGRSRTDPKLRCAPIHQALRDARGPARQQDPRHFRAARHSATASRNICVTCPGYGATCSARSAILPWSRSMPGILPTCPSLNTI
jgi:hypothetical protein